VHTDRRRQARRCRPEHPSARSACLIVSRGCWRCVDGVRIVSRSKAMELADNRRLRLMAPPMCGWRSGYGACSRSDVGGGCQRLVFGAIVTALAAVARRVSLWPAVIAGAVAGLGYGIGVLLLQWAAGPWG
jgi:hypothetical protein